MPLAGLYFWRGTLAATGHSCLRLEHHQLSSAEAPARDTSGCKHLRRNDGLQDCAYAAAGASRRPRASRDEAGAGRDATTNIIKRAGPRRIINRGPRGRRRHIKSAARLEGAARGPRPVRGRGAVKTSASRLSADLRRRCRKPRRNVQSGRRHDQAIGRRRQTTKGRSGAHPPDDAGQAHDDALRLLPGRLRHGLRLLRDGQDGFDTVAFVERDLPAVVVGAEDGATR